MKRWQLLLGVTCFLVGELAFALSLGRLRGTPLLGRGLDVSVQSSMDAGGTPDPGCIAVEVFYGDTRVSPNSIVVAPERSSTGDLRIRIRSSVVVDEPVVTLYIRTVCGPSVSRRYVLLSELVSDAEPSQSSDPTVGRPAQAAAPSARSNVPVAPATNSADSASATAAGETSNALKPLPRKAAPQRPRANVEASQTVSQGDAARSTTLKASGSPRKSSAAGGLPAGRPRLQVDLLDLSSLEPNLRNSFELATEPASDPAVRAQAQALWRMLNASPEDVLREEKRLETLEAQMRQSIERGERQSKEIAALTSALESAKKEKYLNPFTLFLALLTLLAIAGAVWLWMRQRNEAKPWWTGGSEQDREKQEEQLWSHFTEELTQDQAALQSPPASASAEQAAMLKTNPGMGKASDTSNAAQTRAQKPGGRSLESTSPIPRIEAPNVRQHENRGKSQFENTKPPALTAFGRDRAAAPKPVEHGVRLSDFSNSGFASSRLVSADELFDIQEQADFFMSLDQPDQAIAILKNHIADSVETSALAYMDLFDIYVRTGKQLDYAQLRDEFNRVFNAQVPEFQHYSDRSLGLDEYPEVMDAIVRAWPRSLEAQTLIEEYIFRQPAAEQHPFDMNAYRELMLLYTVAKELVKSGTAESMLPSIAALKAAISSDVTSGPSAMDIGFDLDERTPSATAPNADALGLALEWDQSTDKTEAGSVADELALEPQENGIDFDLSDFESSDPPGSKSI